MRNHAFLIVLLCVVSQSSCSGCHDRVLQTAPGESVRAEVHERECGSASGLSIQILPSAMEEIPEGSARDFEPFLMVCTCPIDEIRKVKLEIRWSSPTTLEVAYPHGLTAMRAETNWKGLQLLYIEVESDEARRPGAGVVNPAGWRHTNWGMTVEQAAAVLRPEVEAISAEEARRRQTSVANGTLLTRLQIHDYEIGSRHYEVALAFGERDGLQMVAMDPRDASGFGPLDTREAILRDLESDLTTEYGSPGLQVNNSERRDVIWKFSETDVALHLMRFRDRHVGLLRLVYTPHGWDERRWQREHLSSPHR